MKNIWVIEYKGQAKAGKDPVVSILTSRYNGLFTVDKEQPDNTPDGYEFGELVTQTQKGEKILRAKVFAKRGYGRFWLYDSDREDSDFRSQPHDGRVTIEATKASKKSAFMARLNKDGWVVVSEGVVSSEKVPDPYILSLSIMKERDREGAEKAAEYFAKKDAAKDAAIKA